MGHVSIRPRRQQRSPLALSNCLARQNVDAEPPVVEVLYVNCATGQGRHQLDVALVEKVVILARKAGVRLLLDLEDNVAGLHARSLVTLASELDLGTAANTLVNVDVQDLSVDYRLLAAALLAAILVLDDLAFAIAVRADRLKALDHRSHLAHHGLHTMAIAARAGLDGAGLAASSLALGADDGALEGQLRNLAAVDVLERYLVSMVNGARLGRSAIVHASKHTAHAAEATAAEELRKQVLGGHAATTGSALQTGLTVLIVNLSLLRVRQNFVRMGDFFELFLGLGVVGVLV